MTSVGLGQLEGVRVIDFTQALSGPYCTLMLADLGADVIKVEAPERGDDSRHWGPPFVGDDAAYFVSVNRNKRSVTCDLKESVGLEFALKLIDTADVVVENWRPGTAARLDLGPDAMRDRNPGLVYCSISGYGQDAGTRSGYDQIVQGTSGTMTMTGPVGHPTKWGVPISDIAAGMFAATAIVSVLFERNRTGVGRVIDIAMQDSVLAMLGHHAARYLLTGVVAPSDHNGHGTIAPYGAFAAADGFVNVCVGNDSQFERMCSALDRLDLTADPRFKTNAERVVHKEALLATLEATLSKMLVAQVVTTLESVGVPVGPVVDIGSALTDPLTQQRRMVLEFEHREAGRVRVANTPWKIDGIAPEIRLAPPGIGAQTREIADEVSGSDSTLPS